MNLKHIFTTTLSMLVLAPSALMAQSNPVLTIDKTNYKDVSPVRYGFHYEEIGMIGEGTLHAELIRNRSFEEANMPEGMMVKDNKFYGIPKEINFDQTDETIGWLSYPIVYSPIYLSRTDKSPMNNKNQHSMLVKVSDDIANCKDALVLNKGYFGMNLVKDLRYDLTLFALDKSYGSTVEVFLVDENCKIASNVEKIDVNNKESWTKSSCSLVATRNVKRGMFAVRPSKSGVFQLDVVSLFPSNTYDDGKSIFRSDIIENLKEYSPSFIRFPGGCLVHGVNAETMNQWKKTIGPIEERPGQWGKWQPHYRTDGIGYHEYYELCEYVGADAMYVTPSGLVCTVGWIENTGNKWEHKHPGIDVNYYIQDALDAIEYAIGDVDTKWGALRAKNGHPEPFPLRYIEIGNEDYGPDYWRNYDAIYRALSAKYPDLTYITNSIFGLTPKNKREDIAKFKDPKTVKVYDEHYYRGVDWACDRHYKFDEYERGVADLFIGELGISGEYPANQLALSAMRMAFERNADMNSMFAERPIMRHWDFIGQNSTQMMLVNGVDFSVRTAMFYLSKMFRDNTFDTFIESRIENFENKQDLFVTMGYDSATKDYILKLINLRKEDVALDANIKGFKRSVKAKKTILDLSCGKDNTPTDPFAVTPKSSEVKLNLRGDLTVEASSMVIYRFK